MEKWKSFHTIGFWTYLFNYSVQLSLSVFIAQGNALLGFKRLYDQKVIVSNNTLMIKMANLFSVSLS